MPTDTWQKSSYCGEGDSCVHVAAAANSVKLIESGDPTGTILTTTPTTWSALLRAIRENQ